MGTPALIGMAEPDGSVAFVSVHWDGYVAKVGCLLQAHYQTREKIAALLALGELSSLGAEVASGLHDGTHTSAYHRDFKRPLMGRWTEPDTKAFFRFAERAGYGYAYLFEEGQGWTAKVGCLVMPLAEALEERGF